MLRDNPLKARLAEGKGVLGCWSHLVSPIAAEVVAVVRNAVWRVCGASGR